MSFDSQCIFVFNIECYTVCQIKITDRSFRYASPRLWNQFSDSFCQRSQSCLDSSHSLVNSSQSSSPLSSSITFSLQAQKLPIQQILLLTLTLLLYPLDCLHDNGTGPDLSRSSIYSFFVHSVW